LTLILKIGKISLLGQAG